MPGNNSIHATFKINKPQKSVVVPAKPPQVRGNMQLISQPGQINVDLLMKYRNINHGPHLLIGSKLPIEQGKKQSGKGNQAVGLKPKIKQDAGDN